MNYIDSLVTKEITDLHVFFENFFTGKIPLSDKTRLERALDGEFTIIPPFGKVLTRENTIDGIVKSYNSLESSKINIEVVSVKNLSQNIIQAIYFEHHPLEETNPIDGERQAGPIQAAPGQVPRPLSAP